MMVKFLVHISFLVLVLVSQLGVGEQSNRITLYPVAELEKPGIVRLGALGRVSGSSAFQDAAATLTIKIEDAASTLGKKEILEQISSSLDLFDAKLDGHERVLLRQSSQPHSLKELGGIAKTALENALSDYEEVSVMKVTSSNKRREKIHRVAEWSSVIPRINLLEPVSERVLVVLDFYRNEKGVGLGENTSKQYPGDQKITSIPLWFQVTAKDTVLVALEDLKAGVTLNSNNTQLKKVNVQGLPNIPVKSTDEVVGLETSGALLAGEIILKSDLRRPVSVSFGNAVTVTTKINGVQLSTKATAINNAEIGERVKVRSLSSREIYIARVTGLNQVEVIHD